MYDDDDYDAEQLDSASPLDTFQAEGWIGDVLHEVKSGKEATVYCCQGGPLAGVELVAAKVYRSRRHRSFHNDAVYQAGRYIGDRRVRRAAQRKTAFGREAQFGLWIDHEFGTLCRLHAGGADVPRPLVCAAGGTLLEYADEPAPRRHSTGGLPAEVLLMGYLGDDETPAPHLHAVSLEREEARVLFNRLISNVELWLAHDIVHGDLSAFNILYWRGRATVIDFPQAVDPRSNNNAAALLARDVENVCRYFARQGVHTDPSRLSGWLWRRFLRGELQA